MSEEIVARNILILGNGFDLHHNLKTKYSDFIEFMMDLKVCNNGESSLFDIDDNTRLQEQTLQAYKKEGFREEIIKKMWSVLGNNFMRYFLLYSVKVNGWIDFEILIKNITEDVENVINMFERIGVSSEDKKREGMIGTAGEKLLAKSFNKIFEIEENGKIYVKEELINLMGIDKKSIIQILRKEFDGLCYSLWLYLKDIEPHCREIKTEITYQQIKKIRADAVINFNYTDTYKRYGIDAVKVVYIHGSLQDKNIVLGFNDDNEKELQYVYFKKYIHFR